MLATGWGQIPVFDSHIHFFSHRFFSMLAVQKSPMETAESVCRQLDWDAPSPEPEKLAAVWDAELQRQGVDRAVLIASLPGDEDSVARAVVAFPERFTGYFLLNPLVSNAAERVHAALEAGLRGVVLFPAMHRYSLNDERAAPVFEAASAHSGAIVFVHCGVLSVGVRGRLGLASAFDMRFSNPIDIHPVALRHASLPFVVPHFGAGYFREALMLAGLCPNVHLDTSSSNSWMRFNPSPLSLTDVFRRALDVVGPRRLLFGTDSSHFPRGWNRAIFDEQTEALAAAGVGAENAALIFGGNLARLLDVKRS